MQKIHVHGAIEIFIPKRDGMRVKVYQGFACSFNGFSSVYKGTLLKISVNILHDSRRIPTVAVTLN